MTRDELALMLEQEAQNAAADLIRCGADSAAVCAQVAADSPRYDDDISRNAIATFRAVANGEEEVEG